jgi:ferric-dicitrate binding protein FerR (iron transport regulator)
VSSKRAERALDQLLTEVRSSAPPELDWAALEARLPSGPVPHARERSLRPALFLAAAALAVVGLAFAWSRDAEPPEAVAMEQRADLPIGPVNGDQLAPGTAVSTAADGRIVEHARRASWALAPHSRATVVTSGDVVLVRLDSGRLTASVVPSTRAETFVVEAADVRVAVHGTVFSVTLEESGVGVAVEEGKVLVGPRATPGVGNLLASPGAERFTLAGALVPVDRPERVNRPAPRAAHPITELSPSAVPSAAGAPPAPTPETIAEATGRVVALASTCFSERTSASDGVRVTAHTVLSFAAAPDGSVASIRFEPPLAPNVQECIEGGSAQLRVAQSPEGFRGSRTVDLER